jgi:hypothetical protein
MAHVFLLFTLCFFLKVFMSSLRSVDIIPLRGTAAKAHVETHGVRLSGKPAVAILAMQSPERA